MNSKEDHFKTGRWGNPFQQHAFQRDTFGPSHQVTDIHEANHKEAVGTGGKMMGKVIVLYYRGMMPEDLTVAGCASVSGSVLRLVFPSLLEVALCNDKSDSWQHPSESYPVSRTPSAQALSRGGLWRFGFIECHYSVNNSKAFGYQWPPHKRLQQSGTNFGRKSSDAPF